MLVAWPCWSVGVAQAARVQTKTAPVATPAGGFVPVASQPTSVNWSSFFCTPTVSALSVPPVCDVTKPVDHVEAGLAFVEPHLIVRGWAWQLPG